MISIQVGWSSQLKGEYEVISLINNLRNARTQSEIQSTEQIIRSVGRQEKNLVLFTNALISKQYDFQTKVLLVGCFNIFVQELMKKYMKTAQKKRNKSEYKQQDEIKRQMISMSGKIERGIDSVNVPTDLKPKLVVMQMMITNRSKEDWDSSRIINKMQFYYRKNMTCVAMAYFSNILLMSYSIRQKFQIMKRTAAHFPNLAVNEFVKIIRGEGLASKEKYRVYGDFNLICIQMTSLLTQMYIQISKPIITQWCNSEIWISFVSSVLEQIQMAQQNIPFIVGQHNSAIMQPKQQVEKWRNNIVQILKKMSDHIGHHKIQSQCQKLLMLQTKYIFRIFEQYYFSNNNPKTYEDSFGVYMPLFINAIRFDYFPSIVLTPSPNQNYEENKFTPIYPQMYDRRVFNKSDKQYFLKFYIFYMYHYLNIKIQKFIQTQNQQERSQFLQYFTDLCSSEQIDYQSESFGYNFVVFIMSIIDKYSVISGFVKKLIQCMLFSHEISQAYRGYYQHSEQAQIVLELFNSLQSNSLIVKEIGLLMCLVFYKTLSKDKEFIKNCIQKFIMLVTKESDTQQPAIFSHEPKLIILFMLTFRNYIDEIPVFLKNYNMRVAYKYTTFIQHTTNQLSKRQLNPNMCALYLNVAKHYIRLIKSVIKQVKNLEVVYKVYSEEKKFQEVDQPLKYFHELSANVPTQFYTELYQQFIDYQIFRTHGQTLQSTVARVKDVLIKMVNYQSKTNILFHQHAIFKVFYSIAQNQQYSPLFCDIFQWICQKSINKKWLVQFEQDIIDLLIIILKNTSVMASLNQASLNSLWKAIYIIVQLYQFEQFNSVVSQNIRQKSTEKHDGKQLQKNLKSKQLLVMYSAMTYNSPEQLVVAIFKKICMNIQQCIQGLTKVKNKVEFHRSRPYQQQQISFLLTLHQMIIHHNDKINHSMAEECLKLVWLNLEFRKQFNDHFNFVNGKYNLVVVLLLRYNFTTLNEVLFSKGQQVAESIYNEAFFNEHHYIIKYDIPLYVSTSLELVAFLWSPKYEIAQLEPLLRKAHFAVGACVFCLDRLYEGYKYDVEEQLEVEGLHNVSNDPILTPSQEMCKVLSFLTAGWPYIDEFECFRKFYNKIKTRKQTEQWFIQAMDKYIALQIYIDHYTSLFSIYKMRRKDGSIIYRKIQSVTQPKRSNM